MGGNPFWRPRLERALLLTFLLVFFLKNAFLMISAGLSLVLGLFIFFYPEMTFQIQKNIYRRINWNIEAISYPKEIRNTRMMGLALVLFVVLGCLFSIFLN